MSLRSKTPRWTVDKNAPPGLLARARDGMTIADLVRAADILGLELHIQLVQRPTKADLRKAFVAESANVDRGAAREKAEAPFQREVAKKAMERRRLPRARKSNRNVSKKEG